MQFSLIAASIALLTTAKGAAISPSSVSFPPLPTGNATAPAPFPSGNSTAPPSFSSYNFTIPFPSCNSSNGTASPPPVPETTTLYKRHWYPIGNATAPPSGLNATAPPSGLNATAPPSSAPLTLI